MELITSEGFENNEDLPAPELKKIKTARGSEYVYLDDGRTKRFKPAAIEGESKEKEPKDVLVFIPPISTLKDTDSFETLPQWLKDYPEDMVPERLARDYIFGKGKKFTALINEDSQYVTSNQMAKKSDKLFLCFVNAETNSLDFRIQVSAEPKVGYSTYDVSFEFDEDGNPTSAIGPHIGNPVVDIEYKEENTEN